MQQNFEFIEKKNQQKIKKGSLEIYTREKNVIQIS